MMDREFLKWIITILFLLVSYAVCVIFFIKKML